jgi:L-amino acid N-acyltransferase YncA
VNEVIFDEDSQESLAEWISKRTKNKYSNCRYLGNAKSGIITVVCAYEFMGDTAYCHIALEGMIPRYFVELMLDYPFNQAKVKRLVARIQKDNKKAIKFVEHLGFQMIDDGEIKQFELLTPRGARS